MADADERRVGQPHQLVAQDGVTADQLLELLEARARRVPGQDSQCTQAVRRCARPATSNDSAKK